MTKHYFNTRLDKRQAAQPIHKNTALATFLKTKYISKKTVCAYHFVHHQQSTLLGPATSGLPLYSQDIAGTFDLKEEQVYNISNIVAIQ